MVKAKLASLKLKIIRKNILLGIFLFLIILILLLGGFFAWKLEDTLNRISTNEDGKPFDLLWHSFPGTKDVAAGEQQGRINILLLGMRGADDPAGGLLSDSQMVISLDLKDNKIAMVSIPRDLYVDNVAAGVKTKLNGVYASGEYAEKGGGIVVAKEKFSEITGVNIDYVVVINQHAFKDVIDGMGGVDINLEKDFSESQQFMGLPGKCNESTYTIPTGQFKTQKIRYYDHKTGKLERVKLRKYELCYPTTPPECGGNFTLGAGQHTLSGDQALCFVRARDMTNDFERAKRQQFLLQQVKDKALAFGTLSNVFKVNRILDSLANNVQIDMQPWEMKHVFELYLQMEKNKPEILQHTLEDSPEGLLYWPGNKEGVGYVLLPRGDNYDQIHNLFQNIFSLPSQSDANAKI